MRVDRLLHCICLARSRTLAQAIALPLKGRVLVLEVLALPIRRGPAGEARAAYEEVGVDESAPRS